MSVRPATRVAIVGAGMAGATCARALADAGLHVDVFEKSRGAGGRMATRRVEWTSSDGAVHRSSFDHGAPGFGARSPAFRQFIEQARGQGLVAPWAPRLTPGSIASPDDTPQWVSTPDMPALCRAMLAGVSLATGCLVDALGQHPSGWRLESAGRTVADGYDAVIVAVPSAQAAPLLQPHRDDWARQAQALAMSPVWTLMGVTDDPVPTIDGPIAAPTMDHLASVIRSDTKPGRTSLPGVAHWVAHASAAWSEANLESPPAEVQVELQRALSDRLGRPLSWHYAVVHRWRYAVVPHSAQTPATGTDGCWWDARVGLGVCGDALGGAGIEGAWHSGRSLATLALRQLRPLDGQFADQPLRRQTVSP